MNVFNHSISQVIVCQGQTGIFGSGGSPPTTVVGGGGTGYLNIGCGLCGNVDTSNLVNVDGVPGGYDPLVVPLVEAFRDITRALTGQVSRTRTCPPSKPCRTRRGRCCGVIRGRSRRMVCPARC